MQLLEGDNRQAPHDPSGSTSVPPNFSKLRKVRPDSCLHRNQHLKHTTPIFP